MWLDFCGVLFYNNCWSKRLISSPTFWRTLDYWHTTNCCLNICFDYGWYALENKTIIRTRSVCFDALFLSYALKEINNTKSISKFRNWPPQTIRIFVYKLNFICSQKLPTWSLTIFFNIKTSILVAWVQLEKEWLSLLDSFALGWNVCNSIGLNFFHYNITESTAVLVFIKTGNELEKCTKGAVCK